MSNKCKVNRDVNKRRLPDNFRQHMSTTTTAQPDEVYIEPLQDVKEFCFQMLEKFRTGGEGDYVWRPYNSRFYGELRWKKKLPKNV
ncbi:unnamed protein product [Medioppia subpectinata]|uniref:Uncharacterized protein n=1 Tax=Medioppia subpectinata TaxID=1979941 RepID=A0A7R9PWK2_9ACAR|nr:unnamed protein product [Medioppia subpectinata]CAG2103818.1 unnamed protein product [Medioppia subpectinata]